MQEKKSASSVPVNPRGNSDTITREYMDSLLFKMRLIGSDTPTLKTTLFGQEVDSPIMPGPMYIDQTKPGSDLALAKATHRISTIAWESDISQEMLDCGCRMIEIMKPRRDMDRFYQKIEEAKAKGLIAIGTDIDHAFTDDGTYMDFPFPEGFSPLYCLNFNDVKTAVQTAGDMPFIMKGVLNVDDALLCKEAGVSCIVLSHHHDIMHFSVPPVKVLPEIRAAVGKDMTIIVDCDIRDGFDAMKALSLGADGVLVARPLLKAVVADGEDGAYNYMDEMNRQLMGVMARCNVPDMQHMTPDVIALP